MQESTGVTERDRAGKDDPAHEKWGRGTGGIVSAQFHWVLPPTSISANIRCPRAGCLSLMYSFNLFPAPNRSSTILGALLSLSKSQVALLLPRWRPSSRHPKNRQPSAAMAKGWPLFGGDAQTYLCKESFQPLADPEAWQSKSRSLGKPSPHTLPTSCTLRKQRKPFKSLPKPSKILLWSSYFSTHILALIRILDLYEEADADTITLSRISLDGKPIMTPVLFLMVSDAPHQRGNRCLAHI